MSKGGGTQYMYLPQAASQSSSSSANQSTNQQTQSQSNEAANSNTNGLNLSNANSSTMALNQIPKWLEDAARAGVGNAQGLLAQPTQAYTGDLSAGLNSYQQQAGNMLQDAASQFTPYFDAAKSTVQSGLQAAPQIEAQSLRNGLSGISDYMNPYIQNVVNSVQGLSQQNLDQALKQTDDQALAAHAFGGSRHGVQEGVATAQNNLNTNNILSNLLSNGYNQAVSLLGQDTQNNLTAQQNNQASYQNYLNNLLSGGSALAGIGTAAQNSLNSGISGLMNYGNLAQQTQQNADTAAYNEWQRQMNMPLQLQQLYNQTLSTAPHSTAQSSTGEQTNTGLQSQGTNATSQTNSNASLKSNTQGNTNTNSSGWSLAPMERATSSPLLNGLGGAASLANLFAAPSGGTSAAAGIGSAIGGLGSTLGSAANWALNGLGPLAFSVASDEELKTDIKKLGKDEDTGLDIYSYRYKGDPKHYPKVVGPMAQDIEKNYPGTTKRRGDRLTVHPMAYNSLAGKFAGVGGGAKGLLA